MGLQTLDLNDDVKPDRRSGFWRRQFDEKATRSQREFDWLFGVIMPPVCFFLDPFVFRTFDGADGKLLPAISPFVYILSYTAVMGLAAWLLWGSRFRGLGAALSALFAIAGLVSLGIGVILLPFSLLGLLVLIGALGFTPLFTAVIFLRNAVRSWRVARSTLDRGLRWHIFGLAALLSAVIPYVINVEINSGISGIAHILQNFLGKLL